MVAKVLLLSLLLAVTAVSASRLREPIDSIPQPPVKTIPQPPGKTTPEPPANIPKPPANIPKPPANIPKPPANRETIPQVSALDEEVDIEAFMGEWYMTHASVLATLTDFKDVYCFSSTYSLVVEDLVVIPPGNDDKVSFTFTETFRKGSFKGELETEGGLATNQISEYLGPLNGLWFFKLDGTKGPSATTVIQALGPKVRAQSSPELYQWALVSDIGRSEAFILTRRRMDSESSDAALERAEKLGFNNFWSKLKKVPQAKSCNKPTIEV